MGKDKLLKIIENHSLWVTVSAGLTFRIFHHNRGKSPGGFAHHLIKGNGSQNPDIQKALVFYQFLH